MEKMTEALKYLSGGLKMSSLYPPGHPAIAQQVEKSYQLLNEILQTEKKLMIVMVDDVFIMQKEPLYEASELFSDFLNMFREKGAERVTFRQGLTLEEMSHFYEIMASPVQEIEAEGGLQGAFDSRSISHIILERLEKEKKDLDMLARKVYSDALDVMTHIIGEVRLGNIPKADEAKNVVSEMVDVVLEDKNAIIGLTMIKGYDDYLFNHSVNVSILSVALGESLELPQSTLNYLGIGALLHDLGKVNTAEAIVKKPARLDESEWKVMKKHPNFGHEMLMRMKDIHETSADIALEHHLRYDKVDGYPEELMGRDKNPCSQIVTIADCYDALTTLRPYREPADPGDALKIMEKMAGTTFHPGYYKTFVKMLGIYPAGTLVRLDSNEVAVIYRPNYARPLRPMVRIVIDAWGKRLDEPLQIDLTEAGKNGRPKRSITGTVSSVMKNIDVSEYL